MNRLLFLVFLLAAGAVQGQTPQQTDLIPGISIVNQRILNSDADDLQFQPARNILTIRDGDANISFYDLNLRRKLTEFKQESSGVRYLLHPVAPVIIYPELRALMRFNFIDSTKQPLYNSYAPDFDLSADGKLLAAKPAVEPYVQLLDYSTKELKQCIKLSLQGGESVSSIRFNPGGDGLWIVSAYESGASDIRPGAPGFRYRVYYARLQDTAFKQISDLADIMPNPVFSPDGTKVAYPCSFRDTVFCLFSQSKQTADISMERVPYYNCNGNTSRYGGSQFISGLFFENDSILRVSHFDSTICTYNVKTGQWMAPLVHKKKIYKLVYSPGAPYYFMSFSDETIGVAGVYDHEEIFTIRNGFSKLYKTMFAAGHKLVIATADYLKVFNLEQLGADTTIPVTGVSKYASFSIDTTTGRIVYLSSLSLATAKLPSRDRTASLAFEVPYMPNVIIGPFVTDQQRGILCRLVSGLTGKYNLTLLVERMGNKGRRLLGRREYPETEWVRSHLAYDTRNSMLYMSYIPSGTPMKPFLLERIDTAGRMTKGRRLDVLNVRCMEVDQVNRMLFVATLSANSEAIQRFNLETLEPQGSIKLEASANAIAFDYQNNQLVVGCADGRLRIYNLQNGRFIETISAHEGGISSLSVSAYNRLASVGEEGSLKYWSLSTRQLLGTLYPIGPDDFMFINKQGFYYSTKNGIKSMAFRAGQTIISPEQLDKYFNRPDLVLEGLDSTGNARMVKLLKMALQKRNGTAALPSPADFHVGELPVVSLKNEADFRPDTKEKKFRLRLHLASAPKPLASYRVWVNNVPAPVENGRSFSQRQIMDTIIDETIQLSEGDNKIEVSAINSDGLESARLTRWVTYRPVVKDKYLPTLYVFSIAVDEYQDPAYRLQYAVTDGRRLIHTLQAGYPKDRVVADSFFNKKAVLPVLKEIRNRLMHTNVDDKVVIHFSGHGMVDTAAFEFYFAGQDMDFKKPKEKGISYSQIEAMLAGVPARRKLVLIDACQSGLADRTATRTEKAPVDTVRVNGQVAVLKNAGRVGKTASNTDKQSFALMQQLFWNVTKDDGTYILTASAGDSYALESVNFGNGIFTYFLADILQQCINGTTEKKTVREIGQYVAGKVQETTSGRQKPEMRKDYMDFDWTIF